MAYDEATDQIIMFGGYSGPEDMTGDYHDDTWAYDAKANAWTKLEPSGAVPPARVGHTMAYDPVTQRTIMFGGQMNGVFADTWAYDAKANAWTKLEPSGAVPPARTDHTMAYDPDMHRMIMFGGWGTCDQARRHLGVRRQGQRLDQARARPAAVPPGSRGARRWPTIR